MDVTPLMKAARCGNLEETRKLLKSGADLSKRSSFGIDLLVLACASGERDTVQLIYQELEKVGVEPDLGLAVQTAVLFGHESVMNFLIEQKCDLDDADKDSGVTALMLAVCNGSTRMVSLLLCHGVDPHVRNELGQTALDVATVRKCPDIIPLLQRSSTPLTHRRTCHIPLLKFKIPLITRTEEPPQSLEIGDVQKISTPNCAEPKAYDVVFSSPVSPIKGLPTRRLSHSPLKLQDSFLYPSSQMTAHSGTSSCSLKRLKIDLMGFYTSSLSPEFGYQSGPSGSRLSLSPRHYSYDMDRQSRENLTFSEKIDLLDRLEPNVARERHSKPLWRSLSNRLQAIRKRRRRCGYLLSRQGHHLTTSSHVRASVSHPGFCVRKGATEFDSPWKGSEEVSGGYDAVSNILRVNHLGQYVPVFRQHEIDLVTLTSVTDGDLQEMGVIDQRHRHAVLRIAGLMRNPNNTSSRQKF